MAGIGGWPCALQLQLAVLFALAYLCNQQGSAIAQLRHKLAKLMTAIHTGTACVAGKRRVAAQGLNSLCAGQLLCIQTQFKCQGSVQVHQACFRAKRCGRNISKVGGTQTGVFLNQNGILIVKQGCIPEVWFFKAMLLL